jgi:hypothetical protein
MTTVLSKKSKIVGRPTKTWSYSIEDIAELVGRTPGSIRFAMSKGNSYPAHRALYLKVGTLRGFVEFWREVLGISTYTEPEAASALGMSVRALRYWKKGGAVDPGNVVDLVRFAVVTGSRALVPPGSRQVRVRGVLAGPAST